MEMENASAVFSEAVLRLSNDEQEQDPVTGFLLFKRALELDQRRVDALLRLPDTGPPAASSKVGGISVIDREDVRFSRRLACKQPSSHAAGRTQNDNLVAQTRALAPDRACANGNCSDFCGLLVGDHFVTAEMAAVLVEHAKAVAESGLAGKRGTVDLSRSAKYAVASGDSYGHLLLIRVLELIRRASANAFNITAPSALSIASHFISPMRGADADADRPVHCDESSQAAFHYSAVLFLNDQGKGKDFDGGGLQFWSAEKAGTGAPAAPWLRVEPKAGRFALFSSGWENVHQVEEVTVGWRFSLPVFMSAQEGTALPTKPSACVLPRSFKQLDARESEWMPWWCAVAGWQAARAEEAANPGQAQLQLQARTTEQEEAMQAEAEERERTEEVQAEADEAVQAEVERAEAAQAEVERADSEEQVLMAGLQTTMARLQVIRTHKRALKGEAAAVPAAEAAAFEAMAVWVRGAFAFDELGLHDDDLEGLHEIEVAAWQASAVAAWQALAVAAAGCIGLRMRLITWQALAVAAAAYIGLICSSSTAFR
jgi:hypothetical protein